MTASDGKRRLTDVADTEQLLRIMELCMQFRDKVNENDLVYHIYRNRDGKDQWSIICSAMDWIEVVADSIDSSALSLKNDNASSVKLMTFVVCIDILWEAIQQLHRVFI